VFGLCYMHRIDLNSSKITTPRKSLHGESRNEVKSPLYSSKMKVLVLDLGTIEDRQRKEGD